MYTQCPDCSTSSRVTAEVLKQAAGKVRCGGCGSAFNALEYLSESMPERPAAREPESPLPKLTPEPPQGDESLPKAISAEQSAALLKTLDELAGSDIRIEDTGIEWRVLDDDEIPEPTDDDMEAIAKDNEIVLDELLDESPTPVDQFLTKTPNDIDASEIFEESANAPAQTPVDELRFDDNTPLPDDFDLDDESSYLPESPESPGYELETSADVSFESEPAETPDESVPELALGDPDEWADILGEFSEPLEPFVPPLDAELSALEEIEPLDVHEAEPALVGVTDTPLDMDTQFALQAEAMGIDLSGVHAPPTEKPDEEVLEETNESAEAIFGDEPGGTPRIEPAGEAPEVELTVESGDESELEASDDTGEASELETSGETGEESELEASDEADEASDIELTDEADEASELELTDEADEASELELTDEADEASELELRVEADEASELETSGETAEESELEASDDTGEAPELELTGEADEGEEASVESLADDADTAVRAFDEPDENEPAPLEFGSVEKAMAELEEQSDVFDKGFFGAAGEAGAEDEAEAEYDEPLGNSDDELPASEEISHFVPPQTEEEQTLNLMIDQELLSFAVEDDDGFASTIVISEKDAESKAVSGKQHPMASEDSSAGFESIVMEGEFVRSALDAEKRATDIAAAAALSEQAKATEEAEREAAGRTRKRGMLAAAIALALLLIVQVVHQSREALATIPAFNDAVGPLYRAIGKPLSPTWDVTGWRFEARRDILDEDADKLTVISRIGNTSDKPLPYPLINIALTDRFEETIGNKTLDPAEYLTDDLDPRKLVQPGNNFTAVMSIESPSDEATGYKLQACYRLTDARLRCHVPDFR